MKALIFVFLLVGCKQAPNQSTNTLDSVKQQTTEDGGILIQSDKKGSNEISVSKETIRDDEHFCGQKVSGRIPNLILEVKILSGVNVHAAKKSTLWFWLKEKITKNKADGVHETAYFIFDQQSYDQFSKFSSEQRSNIKHLKVSHDTFSISDLNLGCTAKEGVYSRLSLLVDIQAHVGE